MTEQEITSKSEGYYLPSDVSGWITARAKMENRSESNFLTTFLRRVIEAEKTNAQ